jgi:FAD synthase
VLLSAGPQYNGRGRDNSRSRDNSGAAAALELLGLAAVSVGTNPTFDGRERRVEAHILDFDGDLYGAGIGVEFTARLRGMLRFDDIGALVDQMHHDVAQTRQTALRHR